MVKAHKTQVEKEHYYKNYDSINRFISYYYQTDSIMRLKGVQSVLEIGIGNKTVNNYLKQQGLKVTSCDFDSSLNPDHVADVRKLPFKKNEFDCSLCCEVLEHIPLEDLQKALNEISRCSKKYVVISIPYYAAYFEIWTKFSLGYFTRLINFAISIPYFFLKPKFTGEHYWGLGIKGISKGEFRKKAKLAGLSIIKEYREKLNPHHYYFIMKK